MVEPFKVHNLIVVGLLAIVAIALAKAALTHFGHSDIAQMF